MKSKSKSIILTILTAFVAIACAFMIMASGNAYAAPTYDISIVNGASVKLMTGEGGSGLRFTLNLEAQDFADLQDDANADSWVDGASIGMLLVPAKYYDGEMTVDSENDYIIKQELAPKHWRDSETSGYKTSYVAIYDFPEAYYTEDIIAVGYVQNGATVEYTDSVARSMAQVAFAYDGADKELVEDYWYDSVNGASRQLTVKFDTDGAAAIADKKVAIGGTIGAVATPEKEGLVFDKWYDITDSEKTAWDLESSIVSKNLTLKAAFKERAVHTMAQIAEFEVYDSCNVTKANGYPYTLSANALDIDLSSLNLDLSGDMQVKVIKGAKSVDADYSISGNILSVGGDAFGSAIYGTDVTVQITTATDIVNAPIDKVVTKYLSTTADIENILFYGNIDYDSEGKNYDGYFILANDIDFNGKAIDCRRDCSGYADVMPDSSVNYSGTFGFNGIFDGQNYEIKNVVFEGGNNNKGAFSSLFLNATKEAVIKNFTYTVAHKVIGTYGYSVAALGCNIAASIENVTINISFADGASTTATHDNGTYPVAYNLTHARLKNVTVNYDAEDARANLVNSARIVALCAYQSSYSASGWQNTQAKFDNVVANVTIPSNYDKEVKSFSAHDYEVDLTGLTINVIQNQHIADTTAYEVYSGVSGETATYNANQLTTAFSVNGGTISKVTVKGVNNVSATEVDSNNYSYADGVLSIAPSVFGSTIYGDVEITVNTDKGVIVVTKPVITKYFSSKSDVDNLFIYGGATKYENGGAPKGSTYDGYFVMTQNININGAWLLAYRTEAKDNYYTCLKADNNGETGFKGIFDGKGFIMYNYASADRVGLFGNVTKSGVVKNLGIHGKLYLKTTSQTETYTLGFNFAGALENCYIEIMDIDSSKIQTASPTAMNLSQARFKDVVIKFNATNASYNTTDNRFGWLAAQVGTFSGSGWYNLVSCNNVSAYVQLPSAFDEATGTLTPGAWYGSEGTLTGITRYSYNDTTAVTMTDSTYWTIAEGAQITWAQRANITSNW